MRRSDISGPQIVGGIVLAVIAGLIAYFWFRPGVFEKLMIIVHHNLFFWGLMLVNVVYAFWRRFRNPTEFVWMEVPVQIVGAGVMLYLIVHFFFYHGSDLKDQECWNGQTMKAMYYEAYDQETCTETCDEDGNNCTETCVCTPYPPSWAVVTSNQLRTFLPETVGIAEKVYRNYRVHFGTKPIYEGSQGDQCYGNPGRIWAVPYNGDPKLLVPTAVEHEFVNYLKASKSIRKTTGGNTEGYEDFLKSYPRVHNGPFGKIELDRVIRAGLDVSSEWVDEVDRELDIALAHLGKMKEVNILIYLVGTSDQAFLHALEEHWTKGKKNDVIVLIGIPNFPEVSWVSVMAWTENEDFKVKLARQIREMEDLTNGKQLVSTIVNLVSLPPEQGGFQRMRMRDLKYLAAEVQIAWWAMLVIILFWGFMTWLLSWALENNEIRSFAARACRGVGYGINRLRPSQWRSRNW